MRLTSDQKKVMAETVFRSRAEMYMKPYFSKYKCYCTQCSQTLVVTKDVLKEIRNSHICPMCWRKINRVTDKLEQMSNWISIKDDKEHGLRNGYRITFTRKFNEAHNIRTKLVAKFYGAYISEDGNSGQDPIYSILKDIHIGMYGNNIVMDWEKTGKWKKPTESWRVFECMYGYGHPFIRNKNSFANKKDYLFSILGNMTLKSTQISIAKKHILSEIQLQRMVMFNLNDYDSVRKSNYKMKFPWYSPEEYNNVIIKKCVNENLNKYDQEYLITNNIRVSDYIDYLESCKKLGIKNKHPKDFSSEDEKIQDIIREQKEKEKNEKAAKALSRFVNSLPNYKSKKYAITPVKTIEELKSNAKYMHNCIFGYLEKYSKRECLLYIVRDSNKKIVANVELNGNEIIQIRARYNNNPSKDIDKAVRDMVKKNSNTLIDVMSVRKSTSC